MNFGRHSLPFPPRPTLISMLVEPESHVHEGSTVNFLLRIFSPVTEVRCRKSYSQVPFFFFFWPGAFFFAGGGGRVGLRGWGRGRGEGGGGALAGRGRLFLGVWGGGVVFT